MLLQESYWNHGRCSDPGSSGSSSSKRIVSIQHNIFQITSRLYISPYETLVNSLSWVMFEGIEFLGGGNWLLLQSCPLFFCFLCHKGVGCATAANLQPWLWYPGTNAESKYWSAAPSWIRPQALTQTPENLRGLCDIKHNLAGFAHAFVGYIGDCLS